MKKIIAAAVAAALVAPAYAADVTLGGAVGYYFNATDGAEDKMESDETAINITATEELANGITVTAKANIVDDNVAEGSDNLDSQGSSLSLAGEFGTIAIGDVSGGLDATGDWTDISAQGGTFASDGSNMAVNWTLPTLVEGLTVHASMSPDGTNAMGSGAGTVDDASAYSITYAMPNGVSIYAGSESVGDTQETDAYGIKGTIAGVYVAYETADHKESGGTKESHTGIALKYSMGDLTLGWESQEDKTSASDFDQKETVISASYAMGGLTVYAVQEDVDETKVSSGADATWVGVGFAF